MRGSDVRAALRHLPVILRGRPLHGTERYQPFFIVGSGRCGTTLMRAVLQTHPDVNIPPESHAFCGMVRDYRHYGRLPWSVVLRVILSRLEYQRHWDAFELDLGPIYRDVSSWDGASRNLAAVINAVYVAHRMKHKPTAVRWGDKTPIYASCLSALLGVFPDMRVIHLIRDGRDVAASLFRLGILDLPAASDRWVTPVRAARAFGRRHAGQYMEVRYESFVSDPPSVVAEVVSFLDLAYDDRMLRHHETELRLGDVDRHPHMQGVRRAIHRDAVGAWRSELTSEQVADIERRVGGLLEELGYPLSSEARAATP